MCGIAGLISLDRTPLPEDTGRQLSTMSASLAHRGPDDSGQWISPDRHLGFAHTRLSIIDPSAEAHQPMVSKDGNVLIFNGEIYNYGELRAKYKLAVPPSDTAVLLALLERFGDKIIPDLRGFFTFAFWGASTNELLIARDAIGKKPLYYSTLGSVLLFASEARTLIRSGLVRPLVSADAMRKYLAFYAVPHPLSIFQGVSTLPAGSVLRVKSDTVSISQWYQLPEYSPTAIAYPEAVRETRRLLEESVRYRLVSDVPVGAFLSAGLDSNAVVGLMAREVSKPIETFSIGFHSKNVASETEMARIGATAFGTRHHERIISGEDVAALLPKFFSAMDSPTGDGLNTFLVAHFARAASPSLKVVLSGVGGDELFLGYRKYRWLAQHKKLAELVWSLPAGLRHRFARLLPKDTGSRSATAVRALLDPANIRSLFSAEEITSLLANSSSESYKSYRTYVPKPDLQSIIEHDLQYYLHDTLLRDLDQMTMAHSLEARAPLLDKELMEFAWQLPIELKARGGSKQLLADAVRDVIPNEILEKPKSGFELPMHEWLLRGALKPELDLLANGNLALIEEGLLRKEGVAKVHRDFITGHSHYLKPWSIIVLEHWWRCHADQTAR
ncbi:MAG: asparagine synthase (glutamine-hydrolyzing) [Bacteroidota bacterium]|nr:asparagine synthase (glutamine-hydrolyzing) [Bacteroidota bacterium]MDP4232620.1 asparagine synthase (glutamine-hydrolyzing) [Bacteroidota bacterium]MDP4289280.1 asparagine synthase (glutamine-hydrolyzing) [Bacteroidota bacterium]